MTPSDRYALHRHSWDQLAVLVESMDRHQIRAPGPGGSNSVLDLVVHELDASRRFVALVQGEAPPEPLDRDQVADGSALVALAAQLHAQIQEAIARHGESEARVVAGRTDPAWVKSGELLEVLVWHASHHRAQLSLLLRGRGLSVPGYSPLRWLIGRSRGESS